MLLDYLQGGTQSTVSGQCPDQPCHGSLSGRYLSLNAEGKPLGQHCTTGVGADLKFSIYRNPNFYLIYTTCIHKLYYVTF